MSEGKAQLAPGIVRLRPDDHFMILSEMDSAPNHIGALILLDVPAGQREAFGEAIRRHLIERLPGTPLQVRLVESPEGYDSDVWAEVAGFDEDYHLAAMSRAGAWSAAELRQTVAALSLERLDLKRAPFRIHVFEAVEGGRAALYIKSHHAVADGIGFQTILGLLSDAAGAAAARSADAPLPAAAEWRTRAEQRFKEDAPEIERHRLRRDQALAALDALKQDPATRRPRTPTLKMSGPISRQRVYETLSIDFARVKTVAGALGGTINDLFLAICVSAIRQTLIDLGDLPEAPLVISAVRSYRRPEHGAFGNRITALNPHGATHVADPMERFQAIRAEMRRELARAHLDEAMLDQPEKPWGARDRRAKFGARADDPNTRAPGNVTLSNVPGPSEPLSYAGFPQLANYPVPIIGHGRFLNITSRRNAGRLDMGIMADPTRLPDVELIARRVAEALDEYERLA